ncbi:MAG TPA: DUF2905 domain-containing protein [Candidatus Omnitrophota bacterium]|nr:DUF2905 domain-containing protein [Candidatus Omnitrophota bacterium]
MSKTLIITGIVLIIAGIFWETLLKIPFGRLPGDLAIHKKNFSFYFPIATSILLSLVLSLVFWIFSKH